MDGNEVSDTSFPLYDNLLNIVQDKKRRKLSIIKNIDTLKTCLRNLTKEEAEKIYMLMLHHYLINEGLDAKQLVGKKITFYGQKSMFGGKGVMITDLKDITLLEIFHEFLSI